HPIGAKSNQSRQTKLDDEIPWDALVFSHSLGPLQTIFHYSALTRPQILRYHSAIFARGSACEEASIQRCAAD
ncbi:hypothetical protein ACQKKX_13455, partial [Neorhizobium sp. NPDC001467]|uniref:hypothetical protein n=1 Tax=Neorhizobium sp. NPDC001467 TaxID=3390595 RepID=UPI003D072B8A